MLRDTVELENGKTSAREVVCHNGGVCVAALTEQNEVLLVRQFRYPYKEVLLELPAEVFEFAVPPLILFSSMIIALNPRKKAAARDAVAQALPESQQGERAALIAGKASGGKLHDPWWLWLGVSFVGVYSGYFGAAAGTLALAVLDLGKIGPFHQINALKTLIGTGANISASVIFIVRGVVDWPAAILLCIGCFIGGYIASPVTRRIPARIMRIAAVLAGIVLTVDLAMKTYL